MYRLLFVFLFATIFARAENFEVVSHIVVLDNAQENAYIANELIGADAFYSNGIGGAGAKVANVEFGLMWIDHYSLVDSTIGELYAPDGVDPTTLYDSHATGTAAVIAGYNKDESSQFGYYASFGTAPLATISSGALARQINEDGSASISDYDFATIYKHFFETNQQDVISSSWGTSSTAPNHFFNLYADALLYRNTKTSLVISAGNSGVDSTGAEVKNSVSSFAQAYNAITVGAVGNFPDYDKIAEFSSRSPSDFYNPTNGEIIKNVRAAVDIVSIGENVVVAAYDASDPTETGIAQISNGTSFSAPMVAGTAALMVSLSKDLESREDFVSAGWSADARDSRVIKAVLLNSATKPSDWTNGQVLKNGVNFNIEIEGVSGMYYSSSFDNVIETTQGLDFNYGAGILNADAALNQYVGMYTNGNSNDVWLLDSVDFSASNLYRLGEHSEGDVITMTLVWLVQSAIEESTTEGEVGNIVDFAFSDLSLEIWAKDEDGTFYPIAISDTKYNNVEHLSVTLVSFAEYYVRVAFFDMAYGEKVDETYALAWSIVEAVVPEASNFATIASLVVLIFAIGRKRLYGARDKR